GAVLGAARAPRPTSDHGAAARGKPSLLRRGPRRLPPGRDLSDAGRAAWRRAGRPRRRRGRGPGPPARFSSGPLRRTGRPLRPPRGPPPLLLDRGRDPPRPRSRAHRLLAPRPCASHRRAPGPGGRAPAPRDGGGGLTWIRNGDQPNGNSVRPTAGVGLAWPP